MINIPPELLTNARMHYTYLHEHPELSFAEEQTAAYIRRTLDCLQIQYTNAGPTGIIGFLPGRDTSRTIALRADFDALPISEKEDHPLISRNPGIMHACGHDGHMAILLGLCQWAAKTPLPFHLVAIFQPGEETTGGALPMIHQGVLENPQVDAIFGLHIWPYLEKGKISVSSGPVMAGMVDFDVEFQGKSAHGASRKDGADALVAACQFVVRLNTLAQELEDQGKVLALNIGTLQGGNARNVVCDHMKLQGTLRYFDDAVYEKVKGTMKELAVGLKESLGVECRMEQVMSYPPVVNDAKLTELASGLLTQEERCEFPPQMMSEDFSNYQRQVPGVYAFLGCGDEQGFGPLHSGTFDFDEEILQLGLSYYLRIIERFCQQWGGGQIGK